MPLARLARRRIIHGMRQTYKIAPALAALCAALAKAVVAAAQTPAAKDGAEKSSIPLDVQNAIVPRESMARAGRVINDLPN